MWAYGGFSGKIAIDILPDKFKRLFFDFKYLIYFLGGIDIKNSRCGKDP